MQKQTFFLTLICASLWAHTYILADDITKKLIVIKDPVLHLIDGTPAICISDIRYFGSECRKLQKGITTNQTTTGVIPFGNRICTIKEMIEIENELENNQSLQQCVEYKKSFEFATDYFIKRSVPYIAEIQHIKSYLIKLIKTWSEQRGKPETILLNWSKINGTDPQELKHFIVSFKKLDSLISDLSIFLADLIISCPKSFISSFKDPKEGEAILQKIRAQNGC